MKRKTIYRGIAISALCAGLALHAFAQPSDVTTTPVTGATGTIKQVNYNPDGDVNGFLVGTNILLTFPGGICGGIGALGAAGNAVTYSGNAVTATSGFQTVMVTSFTNNTTKASFTAPTSNAATTYGPTSGSVKQLNYGPGGAVDGFLFTPAGSSSAIFVAIGPQAASALTSLLTVGATVSVTGNTSPALGGCSSNGALESVGATSLTIGTQTVVITGGGPGGGPAGGPHGGGGFGGGPGPHR